MALIQYGPEQGKLCTIVDIVDANRVSARRALPLPPCWPRALPLPCVPHTPPFALPCSPLPFAQALVDGPEGLTGVRREIIPMKWLALTDIKVPCARNAKSRSLTAAWEKEGALAKWQGSAWAKKIAAKATKANSTDFDRFLAKQDKQKTRKAVAKKLKIVRA